MAEEYISAADIIDHLLEEGLKDGSDGKYEPLMDAICIRVSRHIDNWFSYPAGSFKATEATAKYFDGNGEIELWPGYMAAAPTEVAVAEAGVLASLTTWSATDYIIRPYNALAEGFPYRSLLIDLINGTKSRWTNFPMAVKITCQWGWSEEVPPTIEEACIIQGARWFKRGQQAFQDAGAVTELMMMRYLKKIDPDVEILLAKMPGGITI